MGRSIFKLIAAVTALVIGVTLLTAIFVGEAMRTACRPSDNTQVVMTAADSDAFTTSYDFPWIGGDEERNQVATAIGRAAIARGASRLDLELALAVAMHESHLQAKPTPYGGAYGSFQMTIGIIERDGTPYWGTREQVENATYATNRWLDELDKKVPERNENSSFLEVILEVQNPNETKYRKRWAENDFERIAKEVVTNGLRGGEMPARGETPQVITADYSCTDVENSDGSTNIAEQAITFAMSQTGTTYSQAPELRENPGTSFDCSGLTHWAYKKAGLEIGATSYEQWEKSGPRVLDVTGWTEQNEAEWLSELQRGDLLFWFGEAGGHVGIYMGGGQIFDASSPSRPIGQHAIAWVFESGKRFVGATRPAESVEAVRLVQAATVVDTGEWQVPVQKGRYRTTSEFGEISAIRNYVMHDGLDLAAACGTPIYAARGGTIEYVGWPAKGDGPNWRGNHVVIDHGVIDGVHYKTRYHHMSGFAAGIRKGVYVQAGDVIGYIGDTGNSYGCHVHFATEEDGDPVNPRGVYLKQGIRF